jgi:hypothetical protein
MGSRNGRRCCLTQVDAAYRMLMRPTVYVSVHVVVWWAHMECGDTLLTQRERTCACPPHL